MSARGLSCRAVALILGASVLGLTASSRAAESVVVAMSAPITIGAANLAAAMELGFFKDENLDVRLQEFQGGSIALTQVATKSIPIGWSGADPLILLRQPGHDPMPIKFFYDSYRTYVWEWVVPQDSPIKTLTDLKGKKVGVGALANSHIPISRLILKEQGLELQRDYKLIPIGIGGPAFNALMKGEVDVYNTWNTNIAGFEARGIALRRLPVKERFQNIFTIGYLAHEDTIKQRPEMLSGFGRAVAKGAVVCGIAVEWCVRNFWKHYPSYKPRQGTEAEILAGEVHALQVNLETMFAFPPGQPQRFGEFPRSMWKNFVDILFEGGELKSKDIDLDALYTNELVPAMNAFDTAKIETLARGLK